MANMHESLQGVQQRAQTERVHQRSMWPSSTGEGTCGKSGFGVRTSLEANRLSCPRSADTALKPNLTLWPEVKLTRRGSVHG